MPGEVYAKHAGKWDGVFDSFKICLDCEEVARAAGCHVFGDLYHSLRQAAESSEEIDVPLGFLDGLSSEALDRVQRLVIDKLDLWHPLCEIHA
ncbi:MAG: hypothetical protein AB7E47_03110 [Desulfovibrionaceae bacterium]